MWSHSGTHRHSRGGLLPGTKTARSKDCQRKVRQIQIVCHWRAVMMRSSVGRSFSLYSLVFIGNHTTLTDTVSMLCPPACTAVVEAATLPLHMIIDHGDFKSGAGSGAVSTTAVGAGHGTGAGLEIPSWGAPGTYTSSPKKSPGSKRGGGAWKKKKKN